MIVCPSCAVIAALTAQDRPLKLAQRTELEYIQQQRSRCTFAPEVHPVRREDGSYGQFTLRVPFYERVMTWHEQRAQLAQRRDQGTVVLTSCG